MKKRKRNKKRKNKTKVIVYSIGIAILLLFIFLVVIPFIRFPSRVVAEGFASDGKTGRYAVTDGSGILFYANYNNINGIYRMNLSDNTVHLFCKTEEVGSIASNSDTVFYTYRAGKEKNKELRYIKSVNKLSKKVSVIKPIINENIESDTFNQLDIYDDDLFIKECFYINIKDSDRKILDPANSVTAKDFFSDFKKEYYFFKKPFGKNALIFGINDNGCINADNFNYNFIDYKSGAPVLMDLYDDDYPIGIKNGKIYMCNFGTDDESNVIYKIRSVDNSNQVSDVAVLPIFSPKNIVYQYYYYNRIGDNVILLGQAVTSDGFTIDEQKYHLTDAAVFFNFNTGKAKTILSTSKKQRILYCDLEKAIVYENGKIYSIDLKTNKRIVIYKLPCLTMRNLLAEPCGNYLFLYSSISQSYNDTINWNLKLITYLKIK